MGLENRRAENQFVWQICLTTTEKKKSFYVMQDVDYQFLQEVFWKKCFPGMKRIGCTEKAKEILKSFSLGIYADAHPSTLSGGQNNDCQSHYPVCVTCLFIF